jgi:hypothetical protein
MTEHEHDHETCRQLLASLGEYVDGALSQDLCVELEKHMKDCECCQVVVNTLKKTVELYHEAACDENMPEDVRKRLFIKLDLEDYIK